MNTSSDARRDPHYFTHEFEVPFPLGYAPLLLPSTSLTLSFEVRVAMSQTRTSSSTALLALFTLVATMMATTTTTSAATSEEKGPAVTADDETIMQWLEVGRMQGRLNQYGDAVDTMYAGGSPLFDEQTARGGRVVNCLSLFTECLSVSIYELCTKKYRFT